MEPVWYFIKKMFFPCNSLTALYLSSFQWDRQIKFFVPEEIL